jgi:hypothetical protein
MLSKELIELANEFKKVINDKWKKKVERFNYMHIL